MKLFVTDYDETLYTDDKQLKRNIIKLHELQQNNFLVVISTGRSYPSIKRLIDLYQIPYDYLSCSDGSIIYDQEGKVVKEFIMNQKIVSAFQTFYQSIDYEEIQFSYSSGYQNSLKKDGTLLGINICLANLKITKKIKDDFLKLKKLYPNYNYLIYTHINYSYLCIKPPKVSKSKAISYLQKKEKIAKKDIYVIGDSSNDLEMIKDFHGVGMKKSCSEILNIVNKTYLSPYDYINDILKS